MSSSLFHDCLYPYETYPNTEYVEGDKKFEDIKENDTLFLLEKKYGNYAWKELTVKKEWHNARGHCYISTTNGKQKVNIDFGPNYVANVSQYAKRNSIIFYKGDIIGTNKNSILQTEKNIQYKQLKIKVLEYKRQQSIINELNKL